jgi:phage FluMu protein Com
MKEILNSYRCTCGKMLLKGFIFVGEIEIKCRFCKEMNIISGVNGNLSNNHRYLLITDKNGLVTHSTASTKVHLGITSKDIVGMDAHTLLGFDPVFYTTLWKKLGDKPNSSMIFQTTQQGNNKPAVVQVGVRIFTSLVGKEHLMFDVETNPTLKALPIAPPYVFAKSKRTLKT